MDASHRIILFLMLCCFINLVFAQNYEDPEGLDSRISKYRKNVHMVMTISKKPDPVKDIDLTYPDCGFRSPKIEETRAQISNTGGRGRGLLSHRSKRSTPGGFPMIFGGYFAKKNSWPWMVAIYKEKDLHCGASLISQNYVLTAAHCFDAEDGNMNTDPSKFSVVLGAHSTNDGTEYPVRQILVYPDYKLPLKYHDIALIAVGKPVELSKEVYPVCLPSAELSDKIETDNSSVTVTGWGHTSYGGERSIELQEVTIQIVPFKECNASYSMFLGDQLPRSLTKQQMCAGVEEGGKDTCEGDSGGPLVSKLEDNSYVQLGIVSFGVGCAEPGHPGVYTKVSEYTKWIYDNTDLGK